MGDSTDENDAGVTIIQRRKRNVQISDQEILMMLRSYREHPCSWIKIIDSMKTNMHTLPDDAQVLFKNSTFKQLKGRLGIKLTKLLGKKETDIKNTEIRYEILKIKDLEKKLILEKQQHPIATTSEDRSDVAREEATLQMSTDDEFEPPEDTPPADTRQAVIPPPLPQPVAASSSKRGRDEKALATLTDKKRKRSVMDLVRENQIQYNKFITKKMPKLLKALGVSSDSSESD